MSIKIIKLSLSQTLFKDTSFDELSGIGIPEILLKFVSCYGFVQEKNLTLIFMCRSRLVLYYLSKTDYCTIFSIPI